MFCPLLGDFWVAVALDRFFEVQSRRASYKLRYLSSHHIEFDGRVAVCGDRWAPLPIRPHRNEACWAEDRQVGGDIAGSADSSLARRGGRRSAACCRQGFDDARAASAGEGPRRRLAVSSLNIHLLTTWVECQVVLNFFRGQRELGEGYCKLGCR